MKNPFLQFLLIISTSFLFSNQMNAQLGDPQELLNGDIDETNDYKGPYHIKVHVIYENKPGEVWTLGLNLEDRTRKILNNLNQVYNPYNIYFVAKEEHCGVSYSTYETPFGGTIYANLAANYPNALVIFDKGSTAPIGGEAFKIPNSYCMVSGNSDNDIPFSQNEVVIHEVGHCLGLSHTFYNSCPANITNCFACGDYVCDTPLNTSSDITLFPDCSAPGIPEEIRLNYMSYQDPSYCRKLFTRGQVWRMWRYLSQSAIIDDIQIKPLIYPTSTPSTIIPNGNIIVESGELIIDSPISMLPGATIFIKNGAKLRVKSTITGACNKMWQGIIVEGNPFAPQGPAFQGKITVTETGLIEHAKVAIDAVQVKPYRPSPSAEIAFIPNTGGGIVNLPKGNFKNNIIGVRFGRYSSPLNMSNTSFIFNPSFTIDDDYRAPQIQPIFADLNEISRIYFRYGVFQDIRTDCQGIDGLRAIGINAKESGFKNTEGKFYNLSIGIKESKLTINPGSFHVSDALFSACETGISASSSNFTIQANTFDLKTPPNCSYPNANYTGVKLEGATSGFILSNNIFESTTIPLDDQLFVGTVCYNTGEGMGNNIFKNSYKNISVGNKAVEVNRGPDDGLVYNCNQHIENYFADYHVEKEASIKPVQAGLGFGPNNPVPAGNEFSEVGFTIYNDIASYVALEYLYSTSDDTQNPSVGNGTEGLVTKIALNQINPTCSDPVPCDPCSEVLVQAMKNNFNQTKQVWKINSELLNNTTSPAIFDETQKIVQYNRLKMNDIGARILRYYELDTISIQLDSVIFWLNSIESYAADLRLLKHYYFSCNQGAFEKIWERINSHYKLSKEQEEELVQLDYLFKYLQKELKPDSISGCDLSNLSESAIKYLSQTTQNCDEAAFISKILLLRNGIDVEVNCEAHKEEEMKERKNDTQSNDLAFSVYPNPVNQMLYLQINPSLFGKLKVNIVDLLGQSNVEYKIEAQQDRIAIPTAHFPNGLYFVRISSVGIPTETIKIFIQH